MSITRTNRSGITLDTSPKRTRSLTDASGLPGPVRNISASALNNTSISVSWEAPIIQGEGTSLTYQVLGAGSASVTGTSAVITGLAANTSYTFTILAQAVGIGTGVPIGGPSSTTFNFTTASGGTETTYSDSGTNYKVHTFTSSGTLTVTESGSPITVMAVSGGSSGSGVYTHCNGSPGGAGGNLQENSYSVPVGSVSVTVGNAGNTSSFGAFQSTSGNAGGTTYSSLRNGSSVAYVGNGGGGGGCPRGGQVPSGNGGSGQAGGGGNGWGGGHCGAFHSGPSSNVNGSSGQANTGGGGGGKGCNRGGPGGGGSGIVVARYEVA